MKKIGILVAALAIAGPLFKRTAYYENFKQLPLLNASVLITDTAPTLAQMALRLRANRDWELTGTNAVAASAAFSDAGGMTLTTAGASGDQVFVQPHTDPDQTALAAAKYNTRDEPAFLLDMKTGASIADVTIHAGLKLTNTGTIATDNNQAYFRYNPGENGGKWQAIVSRGGTDDTAIPLGDAVEASTDYQLFIEFDSDRRAHFNINGEELYVTETGLTDDVDLKPFFGVQAGAVATKAITVYDVAVSKLRNA